MKIPNFLINYLEKRNLIQNFKKFINNDKTFIQKFSNTEQSNNPYYAALLSQYCKTNGKICEELQEIIIKKSLTLPQKNGESKIFGKFNENKISDIINDLESNGYSIYENLLPEEICNDLYNLSKNTPYTTEVDKLKVEKINFQDPKGEVCNFSKNDILNMKWVQELMCDPLFISVSENYFKSNVIFDFPAMWWSFPFAKRDKMESAQYFHFDFDRIKWLKVFIYLTDVDDNNGPHCYIRGSHKVGSKPTDFLKRGYERIADHEINKYYQSQDIISVKGKRGLIIFGDTKCWHKGEPLVSGHRLLLEFQYTSSLYGARIKGIKMKLKDYIDKDEIIRNNPTFFDNIELQ